MYLTFQMKTMLLVSLISQTVVLYGAIEADFSFAANNLSSTRSEPGRPIQSAAKAYLGRTLLYQGKWGEALSQLEAVINSGDYALNPDYSANFRSAGENSSEMIFAIQFASDGGQSPQVIEEVH